MLASKSNPQRRQWTVPMCHLGIHRIALAHLTTCEPVRTVDLDDGLAKTDGTRWLRRIEDTHERFMSSFNHCRPIQDCSIDDQIASPDIRRPIPVDLLQWL